MLRGALPALLVLCACSGPLTPATAPAPPPRPALPPEPVAPPPSQWPFWQAPPSVPSFAPLAADAADPPLAPSWLASDETWRSASASILGKLRETGSATRRTGLRERGVGAFYEDRARRGAPLVVTIDALFAVAHVAFASAAAEVEAHVMRAELSSMLHRLDARLAAEAKGARPDLVEGYRIARTVVGVALAVAEPAYVVPADLVDGAALEIALVRGHAGVWKSPLLGVAIDYGAMAPRGPIGSDADPRAPLFEAAEWLAEAPFLFAGYAEKSGAAIDVGAARGQARAALLVARLLSKEGDAAAAPLFDRMTQIDRFVLGDAGDLSPVDVAALARRARLDLRGGADIADTAKLDRVRHLAAPRSMRLLPLRQSPEGRALEREHKMPDSSNVVAWLGSLTANEANHESFYGSLVEAMASCLRPSLERGSVERRKVGTALVAWTFLRHDALAFAHDAPTEGSSGARPVPPPSSRGHARQVFVEPRPESIAGLLGAVGQLRIGLIQLGGIEAGGPSAANLAEVESVLTVALEASGREGKPHDPGHVGGRPQTPGDSELEGALVDLPERMAALEARLGPAANPVVIDVGFDVASGRVLEEGTGPIDEVFMRVRDPASHRAVVAVGASIPHVEREEQGGRRLDDGTWRSWIEQGLVFAGEPE